jgi:hypothetical protein
MIPRIIPDTLHRVYCEHCKRVRTGRIWGAQFECWGCGHITKIKVVSKWSREK